MCRHLRSSFDCSSRPSARCVRGKIEERPDHGDGGDAPDRFPARRDLTLDDVRRELEREILRTSQRP